jgi:hypothetical protein
MKRKKRRKKDLIKEDDLEFFLCNFLMLLQKWQLATRVFSQFIGRRSMMGRFTLVPKWNY